MTSTAQSRSTELFEGPVFAKRSVLGRSPLSIRPIRTVLIRPSPLACHEEPIPIEIAESKLDYEVIVPLSGIDPRKIYVLAKPRSLLIEARSKSIVRHATSDVTERIERRLSREFVLPADIEAHSTTVRVCGDSLRIRARKSENDEQIPWSELIHFDTR